MFTLLQLVTIGAIGGGFGRRAAALLATAAFALALNILERRWSLRPPTVIDLMLFWAAAIILPLLWLLLPLV